jgi:hypothetical protein
MFMPTYSSLPATQTDLDTFLTFLQENFRVHENEQKTKRKFQSFQENSVANFKKVKFLVLTFICQLGTHVQAKFQLFSFYPDGLQTNF